jgi:pimeloyl-ACP methyl ester carboxylesterase
MLTHPSSSRSGAARAPIRCAALLAIGLIGTGAVQAAEPTDLTVIDLPLSGGDVQRIWYRQPAQPVAALVLLTGGDGVLSISSDGVIRRDGNFLVRTRAQWIEHGFAVAIPDVPGDRSTLMNGRLSRGYGEILRRIVELVRTRTSAPIWLVGTSQGTNAAANGAALMTQGEIAGVVLTSSVSRPSRQSSETVFAASLALISVPTLIVSHQGDRCVVTPPSDAAPIQRALTKAPKTEVMLFNGGFPPRSTECEAYAEHGYFGIESQVIDRISEWIKTP